MRIRMPRRLGAFVPLLLAAAPLGAQEADSVRWCVPAAAPAPDASAEAAPVRWTCTGVEYDAAVRFAVSLPAGWEVTPPDGEALMIGAGDESAYISVSAQDQLHAPRTRSDTLGFWMRATGLARGRDPELADLDAFRGEAVDPPGARRAVTRAQSADSALLAMARGMSVGADGTEVLRQDAEVRTLAGRPAGYLDETYAVRGVTWRVSSYVAVHDAVVFVSTFAAPEDEYDAALPRWEQVLASLEIATARDGPPARGP